MGARGSLVGWTEVSTALLRPIALEYRVSGSLDGVTPAPVVPFPPDPASPLTADQFILQNVVNLGLLDLTRGSQYAGRVVKWIEIIGPNVPTTADNVGVAFSGVAQRTELTIPGAANGIYSRNCIFVPQTGQLRLNGMAAGVDPVIVRVGIYVLKRLGQMAEIQEACCCHGECLNDANEPCFVQALYSSAAAARAITNVNPASGARGANVTIVVTGTGFTATDQFRVRQVGTPATPESPTPISTIPIDSLTFINPTTVELRVEIPISQPLGLYDVVVSPALGAQAFTVGLADSFTVTT